MISNILKDKWELLSKITFNKAINSFKIILSYFLSRSIGRPIIWGLPINISIEPTTSCNLRCPECPSGLRSFSRPTGMLQHENMKRWISDLKNNLISITFYFQGEPYLNPDFLSLVKTASENNIYTVTSTNAHYLNPDNANKTVISGLNKIIISIDGASQDVYESYRIGGNLSKVIDGTKNLIHAKKQLKSRTPHIVFQCVVFSTNEHQIDDIKKIGKELGVDEITFKTAQVYDFENGNPLIPTQTKFSRYSKNNNGKFEIKNKLLNHCWKMWHSCVITWDGKIVPCCFDKDASHSLGSLKDKSFASIWNGNEYSMFRKNLLISRKEIDICKNCTEGTNIWAD
jgi:radical SAM protein with 4Fe4S-binding SPASM domain